MVSGQRILLVAAEPREFAGLLPLCSGVKKLDWPVDWAKSGECGGKQFRMVANGAGWARAGRAVEAAYAACKPEAIVSMGFCGALDPALNIGDVFVATSIESAGRKFDVCAPFGDLPAHASGVIASIDHIAGTAAEKSRLRSTGASAVEMEAAGVALRAVQYSIPMYCVRSVTDLGQQDFAMDFNEALREDGHFDTIRILTSAFRRPGRAFPELIRLRRSCLIAARSLGEFIACCRF